jgi:hypothetical protein
MNIDEVKVYIKSVTDKLSVETKNAIIVKDILVDDKGNNNYIITLPVLGTLDENETIEIAKITYTLDLANQSEEDIKKIILMAWMQLSMKAYQEAEKLMTKDKPSYVV